MNEQKTEIETIEPENENTLKIAGIPIESIITWILLITLLCTISYYRYIYEQPVLHCTTEEQTKFTKELCNQYPDAALSCFEAKIGHQWINLSGIPKI